MTAAAGNTSTSKPDRGFCICFIRRFSAASPTRLKPTSPSGMIRCYPCRIRKPRKRPWTKLDLLVAIDANYSETGWYADVLLPSATYLEKSSVLTTGKGLKPSFGMRQQAVEPRNDAKPDWWIFKSLAERLGAGEYFKFKDMEEFWEWQLKGTGVTVADLEKRGRSR